MTSTPSTAHAQSIIESSDDAILSKDTNAVITSWNPGAERLYGYAPEEAIGEPISILIPPHRANEERMILGRILAGEKVEHYETERVRKDGSIVFVSLSVSPVRSEDGGITGASVIARDITERRQANERARRLQRITAALSREISSDRVAELITEEAVPAVGADAATVAVLDGSGETLTLIAAQGYSEEALEGRSSIALDAELPMSVVVRTGGPVWSSSSEDAKRRFPDLPHTEFAFESLAAVPLTVDGRTFGSVAFSFKAPREFSADEQAFMLATAHQAADALDRTRLHESERRAREQLGFIARASEFLGSSLDPDETLRTLASVAVPEVADWCVVHLVEPRRLRAVAISHADPEKVAIVSELQERYPPDPNSPRGLAAVVRTGDPELYPEIDDAILVERAHDEEHLAALRKLGMRSAMVVPLVAHGRTLGAITFVAAESGQRYGEEDLSFTLELARHAALAIDNANRYRREHEAAITLQRALLPRELPKLARVEFAARYLPAGPGVEAGGDWYDAIELDDGSLYLVIGDVSGRGIPAASIMGRLRTAIRAYAIDLRGPAEIATRIDRLLTGLESEELATMFLLRLDPANGRAEFARAGHPPALIREPDGEIRALEGAGSGPLGVMLDAPRPSETIVITEGSAVLLYTDGLIERRNEVIDEGIARLGRVLASSPSELGPCLDAVVAEMMPEPGEDDVAALIMGFRQ